MSGEVKADTQNLNSPRKDFLTWDDYFMSVV